MIWIRASLLVAEVRDLVLTLENGSAMKVSLILDSQPCHKLVQLNFLVLALAWGTEVGIRMSGVKRNLELDIAFAINRQLG